MTWVAVAVGGSAVVGAGAGIYGSGQAAKAQQGAGNASIGEQQREYDQTRSDNQTSLGARNYGLAQMTNLADTYKSGPSQQDVLNSPGYQFGLTQGQNGMNQNAAATGSLYSGSQLRAGSAFNSNYATGKYDDQLNNLRNAQSDQFNRYASLSGQGQVGANAINQAGQNMANNNSQTLQGMGNAQGAAGIAQSNQIGKAIGGVGSGLSNWFSQPGSPGGYTGQPAGYNSGGYNNYNYGSVESGWADGGPVTPAAAAARQEPVVGSTSPVRTGGGGALSSQAIINAILQRQAAKGLQPPPPPNPLNPAAVLQAQEQSVGLASGGPVEGPGGPRDDAIPARLSNGEHVMDVASVNALGNGDNALGQAKLNMLRAKLKGMH